MGDPTGISSTSFASKNLILYAIVQRFLPDYIVNRFGGTPDKHRTDRIDGRMKAVL